MRVDRVGHAAVAQAVPDHHVTAVAAVPADAGRDQHEPGGRRAYRTAAAAARQVGALVSPRARVGSTDVPVEPVRRTRTRPGKLKIARAPDRVAPRSAP